LISGAGSKCESPTVFGRLSFQDSKKDPTGILFNAEGRRGGRRSRAIVVKGKRGPIPKTLNKKIRRNLSAAKGET